MKMESFQSPSKKSCLQIMQKSFSNCFRSALRGILSVAFFLIAGQLYAASLLNPEMQQLRDKGFNALFNMKYDEARSFFEQMQTHDPNDPAGHIYMANAIWLGHLASLRRLQTNVYNRDDSFFDEKANDEVDPKVDAE